MTEARARLPEIRALLLSSARVVLTTHVGADGDGAGSEVALARWLRRNGVQASLLNPTPFPESFAFLLGDVPSLEVGSDEARAALREADAVVVLDTSERTRLGKLWPELEDRRLVVVDHHPPDPSAIGDLAVRDPTACATGELIYDLVTMRDGDLELEEARALYVAVATDTGSFRFSNTTPRTHEVAARLLEAGVDPSEMYRRLYGRLTESQVRLLRRALDTLERDPELPLAWIVVSRRDMEEAGADAEDREGLVEYARRLEGVEVAMLFRELPDGRTKVSLRSNGETDVARLARRFGGGGHEKAAGAVVDEPFPAGVDAVLEEVRGDLRSADR